MSHFQNEPEKSGDENPNSNAGEGGAAADTPSISQTTTEMVRRDDANIHFSEDPDFFNDPIVIAHGRNKEDRCFSNQTATYGKLVTYLSEFRRGPKNGQCILQGSLAQGALTRLTVNQSVNYLMMIDVDNGMPLSEIDNILQTHNLHAVLYTTHSHGKGQSAVPEKKMVAYQRDKKAAKIDAALVVRYLLEEKGYDPSILASADGYLKKQQDGGVQCIINHAPMPRYRIVFKLKTPFAFVTEEATQAERITEWKELYAGVCRALKIPYDTSCVDPSRLMFLPRIAPDAVVLTGTAPTTEDEAAGHSINVFDGVELDLEKFERYGGKSNQTDQFSAFTTLASKAGDKKEFVTSNVTVFAAKYPDFKAGTCLSELAEGDEFTRQVGEGKFEVTCPTADLHTDPDKPGMSRFVVWDASDGTGWGMHCQGDTCKRTSGEDRLFYLDKWCQAHGISDALDEKLLHYSDIWHDEQKKKREVDHLRTPEGQAELRAKITANIANLATGADNLDMQGVISDLVKVTDFAERQEFDNDTLVAVMAKTKSKRKMANVQKEVDGLRDRALAKEAKAASILAGEPVFTLNDKGQIKDTAANIRLGLQAIGVKFTYNEFSCREMIAWNDGEPREITDADVNRVSVDFDDRWDFVVDFPYLNRVVSDEARQHAYHPVREFFDGVQVEWDRQERLPKLLSTYFGATDTELNGQFGLLWMVAAVRRVREPGCKFDEVLILESAQGKEKSSALAILAIKPEWFCDALAMTADPKIVMEQTAGKLIVECAEMAGGKKADLENVKTLLSRQSDRARPAYGRRSVDVPRQFVIAGTTNEENYLRDMTGNRRFWPVTVGARIDIDGLKRDLAQLWGEAATLEATGMSIRLAETFWGDAAEVQAAREVENPLEDSLASYVGEKQGFVTTEALLKHLEIAAKDFKSWHHEQIAKAMHRLGFAKKKKRWTKGDASKAGWWRGNEKTNIALGAYMSSGGLDAAMDAAHPDSSNVVPLKH